METGATPVLHAEDYAQGFRFFTDVMTCVITFNRLRGTAGPAQRHLMNQAEPSFSGLVKVLRQQLALSQEDLARQLGVSFATVNRWENGRRTPSRLAQAQLTAFCDKMIAGGKLVLPEGQRP